MKPKTRSPRWQILRDLLALALIGFVLWLAAIGWLPVPSVYAAPDWIRPLPENHAVERQVLYSYDQEGNPFKRALQPIYRCSFYGFPLPCAEHR